MQDLIPVLAGALTFCLTTPAAVGLPTPKPGPEVKALELWVGDWTLVGTWKDGPTEPENKVEWRSHGRWILGGRFVEQTSTWKGNGPEQHWLEILSHDPVKRAHAFSGFSSTGETWVATAVYGEGTLVENGTSTSADGKVATWRNTWVFPADRMTILGKQERESNGARWTSFSFTGTKAKVAAATQ